MLGNMSVQELKLNEMSQDPKDKPVDVIMASD